MLEYMHMDSDLGYVPFDCDNHYYEAIDAFTRHLDPKHGERVIQWCTIGTRQYHVIGGKVSHAVVNPTFDPATSFQGAKAMVRELADARLLILEGYGHTALLNPSTCINEHASRYLIDGTLPPVGTTCTQDTPPFTISQP